ncbi:MAG TPA: response regulator [bacterium]|nr:response regulator [bacterium]
MVVDDQDVLREQIATAFALEPAPGYEVTSIPGAREALASLDGTPAHELPDVILLDRMMPDMSGDECILHLKRSDRLRHIPVIFVTARGTTRDLVEGLTSLEAEGYIRKPFDLDEMIAQVKVMARLRRAEERERALERGRALAAVQYGLVDPLALLRQGWESFAKELRQLRSAYGTQGDEMDQVFRQVEEHQRKLLRYLELKVGQERPGIWGQVALSDLLRGLPHVSEQTLAMAAHLFVWTNADAVRHEALEPIVANAQRHGGGLTGLVMTVHGNRVWIAVQDRGPGFPPHAAGRVFEFPGLHTGVGGRTKAASRW